MLLMKNLSVINKLKTLGINLLIQAINQKLKKKSDLSKFLEESKCLNKNIYEEFINCFYNEFRELPFINQQI